MTRDGFIPLDISKIKTYSLATRKSKVSVADLARTPKPGMTVREYLEGLPNILAGRDLREVIDAVAAAAKKKRPVIIAMGAHVIKVGLSPLIIDLMERGVVKSCGPQRRGNRP